MYMFTLIYFAYTKIIKPELGIMKNSNNLQQFLMFNNIGIKIITPTSEQ